MTLAPHTGSGCRPPCEGESRAIFPIFLEWYFPPLAPSVYSHGEQFPALVAGASSRWSSPAGGSWISASRRDSNVFAMVITCSFSLVDLFKDLSEWRSGFMWATCPGRMDRRSLRSSSSSMAKSARPKWSWTAKQAAAAASDLCRWRMMPTASRQSTPSMAMIAADGLWW